MFHAVQGWLTHRRHTQRLQAEYFALAAELVELSEHIAVATHPSRGALIAHFDACHARMTALRPAAFGDVDTDLGGLRHHPRHAR